VINRIIKMKITKRQITKMKITLNSEQKNNKAHLPCNFRNTLMDKIKIKIRIKNYSMEQE